ncbi:FAD-dependent oxidoreductase [Rhodococcus opacus]|uniref:FAD-dependent oxidoreductase n=1 Tax=Rhodococcus opacus TaxID=37919 RepID=UPI0029493F15|nr:FAD-dependent oxidoreductase [Rhodococcus opacus]MDV6247440.1 FAD-dependent oxidoreductase [Rhodococcus opacus]
MPPFYVAIVGSGPAGFFSAAALLKLKDVEVHVDMFERLPTPWGLVRSGVAPDHPKIKMVSAVFAKTADHERFRFFGNVELGKDITRGTLLDQYDAVIYAVGAQEDRRLGIPGEELAGSVAATDVVGWYNGHPDFVSAPVDLSAERAVIFGNGNVALDVARMLAMSPADLRATDIADHALEALESNSIHDVTVLGRRGPLQATFTPAELRELGELSGVYVDIDPADLEDITEEDLDAAGSIVRLNIEALRDLAGRDRSPEQTKRIALRFRRSPLELRGDTRVENVVLARNELRVDSTNGVKTVDSGERETVEAGLVIRAIGYRGSRLDNVPFDEQRGVIPNEDGRVVGGDREYVVGWIKRGPSGIIGTNKKCAQDTVDTVVRDIADLVKESRRDSDYRPNAVSVNRHPQVVLAEHWNAINEYELEVGKRSGRPRVKLCTIPELLEAAHAVRVSAQK